MKLGLDLHGTIDACPAMFAELTHVLCRDSVTGFDHEVHIMTGPSRSKLRKSELSGLWYTHIFSIVDHCAELNIPVVYDKQGNPWLDQYEWNKAKGDYARKHHLNLVIDDSEVYPNFFSTPCAIFKSGQEWAQKAAKSYK